MHFWFKKKKKALGYKLHKNEKYLKKKRKNNFVKKASSNNQISNSIFYRRWGLISDNYLLRKSSHIASNFKFKRSANALGPKKI